MHQQDTGFTRVVRAGGNARTMPAGPRKVRLAWSTILSGWSRAN